MKTTYAVSASKFNDLDYRDTWLKLGAERPTKGQPGGLMLDADDMRVLATLLMTRLPVGQDHGRTVYCESAAEASPALKLLAQWAHAGAEFQEREAPQLQVH